MLTQLKAHLAYYAKAALHTFWQAALASLLGAFAGSGLNIADLAQLPVIEKLGGAGLLAGVAALLSYFKQLAVLPAPGTAPAIEDGSAVPPVAG